MKLERRPNKKFLSGPQKSMYHRPKNSASVMPWRWYKRLIVWKPTSASLTLPNYIDLAWALHCEKKYTAVHHSSTSNHTPSFISTAHSMSEKMD